MPRNSNREVKRICQLLHLVRRQPRTRKQLWMELGVHESTVDLWLKDLLEHGLVRRRRATRRQHAVGRRPYLIELSPAWKGARS